MPAEGDGDLAREIGERIAGRMRQLELTPATVADATGVSTDAIYKLMRGETAKRWIDLLSLARVLRTTPNDLLGLNGAARHERLLGLLQAAFEGLGESTALARNYAQTLLELLDRPQNPQGLTPDLERLQIEFDILKRRFGHQ